MSIANFIKSVFTKSSENDGNGIPQLKARDSQNQNSYENSSLNKKSKNQHNNSNSRNDTSNNNENNNSHNTSTGNDKDMFNLTSEQWCRITDEFPQFSETKELMDFDTKDNQETTPTTPIFDLNSFDVFDTTLDTENPKSVTVDAQKSVNLNTETGEGSALLGKLFNFDHQLLASISRVDALRWRVLPIELSSSTLTVLCSTDTHKGAVIQHFANVYPDHRVIFQVVAWKTLSEYINHHYIANSTELMVSAEMEILEKQKSVVAQLEADVEIPSGIRFEHGSRIAESNVFKIILGSWLRESYARRATDCDIDLEYDHNDRTTLMVRARIDRQQTPIFSLPMSFTTYIKLCTVIKSTLGLDTSSYHNCSSSRTRAELVYGNKTAVVEIRTNMIPNGRHAGAASYSMRFQCREQFIPTFENIGLFSDQIEILAEISMLPSGLILITGGINSGKNTTLHAFLKEIVDEMPNKKVVSLEDPIEANLPGVSQFQINPDHKSADGLRGYSYYTAHAMRHNINVLSVGETRDEKSAEFALEAAKTGQQMATTLHAGSATEAIERFATMVSDSGALASALQCIVNQRLIRMNCKYCEKTTDRDLPTVSRLDEYLHKLGIRTSQLMRSTGKMADGSICKKCRGTGLYGLVGIFEILRFPTKIRDMILRKRPNYEIREVAIKEFRFKTLWMNGLRRAATGDICLRELVNEMGYPDAESEGLLDINQFEAESLN